MLLEGLDHAGPDNGRPHAALRGRHQRFAFKHNLYKLREERDIKPSAFGQLVSATLYEKRCAACQGLAQAAAGRGRGLQRGPHGRGARFGWSCRTPPPCWLGP